MKKKVLIFIEDGSFTYDNRVIREAQALIDDDWDVTVISPKYPDDPLYLKMGKNLRSYHYPKPHANSILGHFKEFFVSLLLGSLLTFWVFLRHGFSVFHACNPMDILWIIVLPYKLIGKKFIFDHHDLVPELIMSRSKYDATSFFIKVFLFFEKCSYKFANAVIATNGSYKETAVQRGGKRSEDVFIVRNGPDLEKFKIVPDRSELKKEGEFLVGYLGNMNPQDGADYLLRAAEYIIREKGLNNFKFIFVGGGTSQPALAAEARKLQLQNNVLFTGRIPDDKMLTHLRACDICVQPDPYNPLNDKSTMNKIMEYMALGKPVVAFDLKETVVSGGNVALYAKSNDYVDLAEKIVFLSENPEDRALRARLGRERIEEMLSWEYSIPHLLAAYNHVSK